MIGGLLGTAGGAGGTGFSGPGNASIVNPTSPDQIANSYAGVQNSLASQQALLGALQGQGGLANQSNVYNQMQGVANGTGPNPAQNMLNQATGANVANQAAMMAGQRGAGANIGLMARQAAQQGAGIQQQAAGQAATMQSQQQLAALGQMGGMADTMAGNQIGQTNANTQAQQAQSQALMGAQQGVNNAAVGMQSNQNNINGQLANTQLQGQQALIGGMMNGAAVKGIFAEGGDVPDTSTPQFTSDSGAAALSGSGGGGGGLAAGAGKAAGLLALLADGGSVYPGMSKFGAFLMQGPGAQQAPNTSTPGFGADAGADALKNWSKTDKKAPQEQQEPQTAMQVLQANPDAMDVGAHGGQVPAMVSPGEKYLSPQAVQKVKAGADPMKVGETIPGKPKVGGAKNSYANDTVKKTLESGGIVVPRSETQSKNPGRSSADFVHKVLAKRGKAC